MKSEHARVIFVVLTLCVSVAISMSSGADNSDLDNPKVREQIVAEALDEANLQTRQSPSGEELHYAPNQQVPYTGWVWFENDESEQILYQIKDGKRHGLFIRWHKSQQNLEKGFYKNGSKDGLWTYWYKNGQKEAEETYKDGSEKSLLWTEWYENGQKKSENTPDLHTTWYENGQKKSENTPDLYTTWYENGQKKSENTPDLHTTWYENGQKKSESTHKAGEREGLPTYWTKGGQKYSGFSHQVWYTSNLVFSPDGSLLAGSASDKVYLWDVSARKQIGTLSGWGDSRITSLSFSPDGSLLVGGAYEKVHLWDVSAYPRDQNIKVYFNYPDTVNSVSFSPDGRTLAGGGDKRMGRQFSKPLVRLWDVSTREWIRDFEGHTTWIDSVRFSPDGRTLASADEKNVYLWDVATGKPIRIFEPDTRLSIGSFSPDGSILALYTYSTVSLWDVGRGKWIGRLKSPSLTTAVFSPDGSILAGVENRRLESGEEESTVRLWDVSTGQRIQSIEHDKRLYIVSFSSDGRRLTGVSEDMILFWEIP